jgi:hypothetical protein
MKTEQELSQDILAITDEIKEKFPELLKYLGEMPEKIHQEGGTFINSKILIEYYESLKALLNSYTVTHESSFIPEKSVLNKINT